MRWRPLFRRVPRSLVLVAAAILAFLLLAASDVVHRTLSQREAAAALERVKHEPNASAVVQSGDYAPVLIPVCSRADYLQQVLQALYRVNNIDKTLVVFSQDCGRADVRQLIREAHARLDGRVVHLEHVRPFLGLPSLVVSNEYATSANVHFLLSFAFDSLRAPAAIVLESDLLPSVDMYDYFRWALRVTERNPVLSDRVLCINGFNMHSRRDSAPYQLQPAPFVVWGWAAPRHHWPVIDRHWTSFGNWDYTLQREARIGTGRYCLSPSLSRIRNIGMQGINFNVAKEDQQQWLDVYLSNSPVTYDNVAPQFVNDDARSICYLGFMPGDPAASFKCRDVR